MVYPDQTRALLKDKEVVEMSRSSLNKSKVMADAGLTSFNDFHVTSAGDESEDGEEESVR